MQPKSTSDPLVSLPTAAQLRDQETTQAFINLVSTPVAILALDGRLIAVNHAVCELTGYADHELIGEYIWEVLLPPLVADEVQSYFTDHERVLHDRYMINRWRLKSGEHRTISWRTLIVYDEDVPAYIVGTGHDVSGLYRATSALRETEANYRRLVTNMNEGLGVQDADGVLTYVNHKFAELLGYGRNDMVGLHIHDILTPDGIAVHQQQMGARRLGQSGQYEIEMRHRDGHVILTRVSAEPILGPEGRFQGSFGVISDITERRAAEDKRETMIAALESFAGTVAHDLKNPLNMVLSFSEFIGSIYDDLSDDQIRLYLEKISRQAKKMNAIIDELMVLASVDADQIPRAPLDTTSILQEVRIRIDHYLHNYPDARLSMPQRWPGALGHGPWIEEVWINYITNALKYGGTPPVIRMGADELPDGIVRFWVRDNGPGIGRAQQEHLFKPWQRLNASIHAKGNGLGLSIVKRIVERLDGTVGVESAPGQGATFWFTLPAAEE